MKISAKLYDGNGNFIKDIEIDTELTSGVFLSRKPIDWIPADKHPWINQPDISGLLLSLARKAEQRRLLARLCRYGMN